MSENNPKPAEQQQSTAIVHWEPETATEAYQLARYYQASALLPKALRNVADVFVTISAGRDFGWSPMQSMRGIYVVEGKPSLSADAMVGICKQSGKCEYFRLVESTAKVATYETKRAGDPAPVRISFTIEEAQAAGLASKSGPWKTYPARMLRNRCKSALAKEVYEELLFGVYEEDEAREIEDSRKPRKLERVQSGPDEIAEARQEHAPVAAKATVEVEVVQDATGEAPPTAGEPPHDPETGEVVPSIADKLFERVRAASNIDELSKLGKEIGDAKERGIITPAERETLAAEYGLRRKAVLTPAEKAA